jgi:hypothetical protein
MNARNKTYHGAADVSPKQQSDIELGSHMNKFLITRIFASDQMPYSVNANINTAVAIIPSRIIVTAQTGMKRFKFSANDARSQPSNCFGGGGKNFMSKEK